MTDYAIYEFTDYDGAGPHHTATGIQPAHKKTDATFGQAYPLETRTKFVCMVCSTGLRFRISTDGAAATTGDELLPVGANSVGYLVSPGAQVYAIAGS